MTVTPQYLLLSALPAVLAAGLLLAPPARAAEGGYSNYVPGTYGDFGLALEPAAKLTLRNDLYYYGADTARALRSGALTLGVDLEFVLNMTTLLYKPGVEVLGGQYAFGTMIPVVHADFEATVGAARVKDDTTGLGDITLIPGIVFWNQGNFHMSLGHYVTTPTGRYSVNQLVNPGLNYWSFDTDFAFTWLNPDSGTELSFNLGHIYNTENTKTNYRGGQEIHLDVAINQFLSETFAVGIHGFYLDQVTGDSGAGAALGGFEAKAAGIGPAVMWATQIGGQDVTFIAKWLHEFDADNRLEGDHVFLSFAMDW
jgi:hypothetical protein